MSTTTAPDWLVPGADVLLYTDARPGDPLDLKQAKVAKVATQSFTVDDKREPRFKLDTLCAVRPGGLISRVRRVVPLDSDRARQKLREERIRGLTHEADRLYDAWRGTRAAEARRALIEALRAIE